MQKILSLAFVLLFLFSAAAWAAVNVNTADVAALEQLPYIGPAKARAIVAERERHGPFTSVEDLRRVKGIGPRIIERLEGEVTVSGD
ncbi:ComEA family DNA-binding protein [Dissulfurirhabdus thermomarina]|uniref:ComEA family DNA-binding protein n=1 Tax=Dissulfurirhabdus thermomarina TaxID=1765737 RepID=A0A6N9TKY4_DISTH|nr:ComEA family DNA-binding protein [Dissulfurirhabdus thermomarina]NDY41942.1 ComEA family DNA-binding protein [Dissulfurirhabdus thermomarina]NMX22926.1 ComEA family DNA-binding protein [Dissulfurirhabdus thermomarina]